MIPADHPVLRRLGISDYSGAIKPTKQSKYKQIDEFLRLLIATLDSAIEKRALPRPTPQRPLRIADMGCGNAYLTFAAAAYMRDIWKEPFTIIGVDARPEVIHRNTAIADDIGFRRQIEFTAGTIESVRLVHEVDVVLSLHACDTATDEALARAILWKSPVILTAPCCHHDIQRQIRQLETPEPFKLLTVDGIIRERFADVLTDSFRASILRQNGYQVSAVQFVGSQHTPRNILLRATRATGQQSLAEVKNYDDLLATWRIEPALSRMLRQAQNDLTSPERDLHPPIPLNTA